MYIVTNRVLLEDYQQILHEIFLTHSDYYAKVHQSQPWIFSVGFYFGEYFGITYKPNIRKVSNEEFFSYIEKIALITPVIHFEMKRSIVLEDPVAGYLVCLVKNEDAAVALTTLSDRLCSGSLGSDISLSNTGFEFRVHPTLRWVETEAIALNIANEINSINMSISGQVDRIILSDFTSSNRIEKQHELLLKG